VAKPLPTGQARRVLPGRRIGGPASTGAATASRPTRRRFSIAAALLVLDIAVHRPGTPLQQVLHAWPAHLAYVVSFLRSARTNLTIPRPQVTCHPLPVVFT